MEWKISFPHYQLCLILVVNNEHYPRTGTNLKKVARGLSVCSYMTSLELSRTQSYAPSDWKQTWPSCSCSADILYITSKHAFVKLDGSKIQN